MNKIKKYNAVIRVHSNTTGIIKERGFVSIAEAEDEWHFWLIWLMIWISFSALTGSLVTICRILTVNTGSAKEIKKRRSNPSLFFYPATLAY